MNKVKTIYKKLHRWPGLIVSLVLLYYGITGIMMNHRELLSGIDVSRKALPGNYEYRNWNNAALKGNVAIGPDSMLIFGNIGIWLTDSAFSGFVSFNNGFPEGSDHRKVFKVYQDQHRDLYAATLFGLYAYDRQGLMWRKFVMPGDNERFTAIESIGDTLYVLNRSYLFKGKAAGIHTRFVRIMLPPPGGYDGKISLFSTIWQIHSGEILGLPGKLFVDLLGITTLFLSATGIIYFFFPGWLKRRKKHDRPVAKIAGISRWSLRWHNKIGAWTFVLLIISFFTGIFLRPPFLIVIANAEVRPLKYTRLDQPNPWYDKLRDILYDPGRRILLISSSDGMYYTPPDHLQPVRFSHQPPVSVMGINTFQPSGNGTFLIGSFSGLFLWNPDYPEIYNYATGKPYQEPASARPTGDIKVTGMLTSCRGEQYIADYDLGIIPVGNARPFPLMPMNVVDESRMSVWNVCLEIHTGRFFQNMVGDFYILIVPLAGLTGIMVVLSGYLLYRKKYKAKSEIKQEREEKLRQPAMVRQLGIWLQALKIK